MSNENDTHQNKEMILVQLFLCKFNETAKMIQFTPLRNHVTNSNRTLSNLDKLNKPETIYATPVAAQQSETRIKNQCLWFLWFSLERDISRLKV